MILRWVRSAVWEAVTSLFGHWSSDYYFSKDRSGEAANGRILLTCGRPSMNKRIFKGSKDKRHANAAPLRGFRRWKKSSRWRHYVQEDLLPPEDHLRMKGLTRRMQALTRRLAIFVFLFLFLWEEAVVRKSRRRYTFVWKRKIVGKAGKVTWMAWFEFCWSPLRKWTPI